MVRLATFNCENLFSRPKVLNLEDQAQTEALLQKIGHLRGLLERESYDGHEDEIIGLYRELRPYVALNVRASRVGREVLTTEELQASGSGDWEGFLDFVRDRFSDAQIENTGRVIREVRPDIQALVEVESRSTLTRFDRDVLNDRFRDCVLVDGNDPRGIDVALACRRDHPVTSVRTNIFEREGSRPVFSRDCLEVAVDLGGGRELAVLVNHFKAKDRNAESSDAKRLRQAQRVADILDRRYDLATDYVAVVGDLNDEPASSPLQPLLAKAGLVDVLDVVGRPVEDRWTYFYEARQQRNTIDYILVSEALRDRIAAAGIERRGIAGLSRITAGAETEFPTVTSFRDAASDHAAVWVDLEF